MTKTKRKGLDDMGQPSELLALRKRLAKRGYSDIHIRKSDELPNHYVIEAREPLNHTKVTRIERLDICHLIVQPHKKKRGLPSSR